MKKIFNGSVMRIIMIIGLIILLTMGIVKTHKDIRTNDALFKAYTEQRELTHQQTIFINELLNVMREFNEKQE